MAGPDLAEHIEDTAVRWAVLAEYGDLTAQRRAELDAWLAVDRRHHGAFLRARAGLYATEDLVIAAKSASGSPAQGSVNDNGYEREDFSTSPAERGRSRWARRALGGAAALSAALVVIAFVGLPGRAPSEQTRPSQTVLALEDGSVATLDPGARITTRFSPDHRWITLLSGRATFKVAHNKARPFVVQSADVYAQATGTVYSVERVGKTGGRVAVAEGSVWVWPGDERDQAVLVHAGGKVTLEPAPRIAEPGTANRQRVRNPELAQLSFDDVPIKRAVARFNAVNDTQIVIANPAVGEAQIVGLFRANDPENFARAAAALTGGEVEHRQGRIILLRKQENDR